MKVNTQLKRIKEYPEFCESFKEKHNRTRKIFFEWCRKNKLYLSPNELGGHNSKEYMSLKKQQRKPRWKIMNRKNIKRENQH